eukprot:CAMPEP_0206187662 /NCGR_PEP_ID=MMETSP0166-20121206/3132_1 /ASSEMBLY_ACC=CAM_ASM_000260 /TAXON_ID=95228 /ORGANISM="Vannella robusta, Strain DIVA3 518/3/11/1/6" /LENGTH=327 /DNA_ID=CAMNT_0053603281 /DNA_START=847 /DNA_END=1827 /DNA_ORIENTATION=-
MSKVCSHHGKNNTHATEECRVLLSKLSVNGNKPKEVGNAKKPAVRQARSRKKQQDKASVTSESRAVSESQEIPEKVEKAEVNTTQQQQAQRNKRKRIKQKPKGKKSNTTDFTPSFDPPDLRLRFFHAPSVGPVLKDKLTVHDVCYVPSLFCDESDTSIYEKIIQEVTSASKKKDELFVEWHGDSHVIANDRVGGDWKAKCPTLLSIFEKMETFFDFTKNATRVNWYRPGSEDWKPYHHDRAAFTAGEPQNFTISASFGCTREVGFEHARNKGKVFIPVANGSAYTFCRDVNIEWKHGVIPSKTKSELGRISIIAWGLRNQDAAQSRV